MNFWTLNKLIVLALIGAFAGLLFEIRLEHQDVLSEHTIAWSPIVYSGLMIVLGLIALFSWERGGRQILFYAFALALVVGAVGFWQHNEHNAGQRFAGLFTVWGKSSAEKHHSENENDEHSADENVEHSADESDEHSANQNGEHQAEEHDHGGDSMMMPPILAPLTFAGLGILGMLACARRFQRETVTVRETV